MKIFIIMSIIMTVSLRKPEANTKSPMDTINTILFEDNKSDNNPKRKPGDEYYEISEIVSEMKKFISPPWDSSIKQHISMEDYHIKAKKEELDPEIPCTLNNTVCQFHAGDLIEHSQWTTLQIKRWLEENHDLVLDTTTKEMIMAAAFFHDIGKGGDCMYNMYSNIKYDGKGHVIHPEVSKKMILGETLFKQCNVEKNTTWNIKDILKNQFGFNETQIQEIALTAWMHWEFGRLNIDSINTDLKQKVQTYLKKFDESCKTLGLDPSERLLNFCIAISCADISGSTNMEVKDIPGAMKPKYASFAPWVAFGMNTKYNVYKTALLESLKNKDFLR